MGKLAGQDLLTRVEAFIGTELAEVEDIFQNELRSRYPNVADVYAHLTRYRGKRLRPILLLLCGSASGGIRHEHKLLSAVVEMIHMATLVHDDVLDEADIRRHVATVNTRWNNETSVLFGDYLFTHAFHLASQLETTLACRLIGRATNLVCEGELLQIHERGNVDLTEDRYLEIIQGKTAELCALCGYLGGHYAGADESVARAMEQYGRSLGIAFQIADDLLDLLGNETETGKTLGSDLQKQKLTLSLIRLLSEADETDAAQIRMLLAHPHEGTHKELQSYLQRSDAVDYAAARADEFAADARRQLQCVPESPARRILEALPEFATHRAF